MAIIKAYEVQYIDKKDNYCETEIVFLRGTVDEINAYCAENGYRIIIIAEYKAPKVISLADDPHIKRIRERVAKEKEIQKIKSKIANLQLELDRIE